MDFKRYILSSTGIQKATKIVQIQTSVFSVFLYGSRLRPESSTSLFEMWCFKRVLLIHWTVKRTNEYIGYTGFKLAT